jgi:hypothetical protein
MAVSGRHAIFLAETLVRLEMLRSVQTYELAITIHTLLPVPERKRPTIVSKVLFRGRDGVLSLDLWKEEHKALRGKLSPIFYDRAGEVRRLPPEFEEIVNKVTAAACCIGCKHTHVGLQPFTGGQGA